MISATVKPGWKTSEFWVSLATIVATMLVATGVLNPADADQAQDATTKLVVALANAIQVGFYIYSRNQLKTTQATLLAENPEICTLCGARLKLPPVAAPVEEVKA